MLPEIGQAALALALVFAVLQGLVGLVGAARGREDLGAVTRPAALAQLVLVAIAYVLLTAAFVAGDFSVRYVADNSNSLLPLVYLSRRGRPQRAAASSGRDPARP